MGWLFLRCPLSWFYSCLNLSFMGWLFLRCPLSWFYSCLNPVLYGLAIPQMSLVLILQLSKPYPLWAGYSSAVPCPDSTAVKTLSFMGWQFLGCPLSWFYSCLNPVLYGLAVPQLSCVLILQLSKPCPLWAGCSSAVPCPDSTAV